MEQKLRDEAKALLEQSKVDYIIGFEPGSLKFTTTPLITRNKDAIDRLVINLFIVNNLSQFLQVNHLDGDYQLKRVGRLIFRKTIHLNTGSTVDFGNWNAFSLDLSSLIQAEPGAIYRIELGFRKQHSLYPCDDKSTEPSDLFELQDYND